MSQTECPVCMVEFDKGSRNKVTTECGHKFHYSCLFKWNQDNTSCPMCRKEFDEIEQAPEARGNGLNFIEDFQARDLVIPVEACGMTLSCQSCNERVEFCAADCGRIVCYCQGPQVSRNITNRSPIQQQNTEYPTCAECWRSRYHTIHDYLDQRMTNSDLLTDEIYETERMEEFYELFFNNTNGNYIDEYGNETLQHSTFTDYDDFQDHIRDTHRRHIYVAEGLEEYEEDAAETVATLDTTVEAASGASGASDSINDHREEGVDIDNLFSVFGIEPEVDNTGEMETNSDDEAETEVDEPVEIEQFELNVQPLCGPDGKIYVIDRENIIYNMNGEVVGERSVVNGEYQIVMNN